MNLDTKVEVTVGCLNFLTDEVENLRKQNKELSTQVNLMNRFLTLTESIKAQNNSIGYGPDLLYQAKREIETAIENKKQIENTKPAEEIIQK